MKSIEAIAATDPDETANALRAAAADQGYALAEGESAPGRVVLTKGVTPISWGSKLIVDLAPAGEGGGTRLRVTTKETFAITDWGRGRRAAKRLFDAIGATTAG